MRKTLALALAGVLAGSAAASQAPVPPAEPQPPTFRSNVNAVLLDVRVVDGDGRFVRDLEREDFEVSEDGARQEVATFQLVDLPFKEYAAPTFGGKPFDPDVASNEDSEGRLYVLLLDDINTHPQRTSAVQALGREFVEHKVAFDDSVVVTTTSGRDDLRLEFTNDRERLLAAIGRFQAGYGADSRPLKSNSDAGAHKALLSLSAIAKWLSAVDGRRKTIVFITEGFQSSSPTRDALDLNEIADTAARSNVTIYGIDPIGLPGAPAGAVKPGPWLGDDDVTSMRGYDRITENRSALAALSQMTGGFAAIRTNDFDQAFDRVVDESSSYYLLGYIPTNTARDGKFRRISVRARRPGLSVRTRSGYKAQNDKPAKPNAIPRGWSAELVNAIQSPVQLNGLKMNVGAAAFRLPAKEAAVEIVVEARPPVAELDATQGNPREPVSLAIVVADSEGHVRASHQGELSMNLDAAERRTLGEYGVRLLARLTLPPGHYAMKIASTDSTTTTTGSVFYPLDVPDLSKGPVALSGLLISSTSELARPTTGPDTDWRARFDVPPTAARAFTADNELTVIGEAYNNQSPTAAIEIATTVTNEAGREVFARSEKLTGKATYPLRAVIPLSGLDPGQYVLSVDARSTAKPGAPASRQVLFVVK